MSSILEDLPEDMLRDIRDGQVKELKALNRMAAMGPPKIEVKVPPAPTQPAPVVKVTVNHAKGWTFRVIERDSFGRIQEFTATPTA